MITFLDGKLVSALPTQAIVNVAGVGYEVFIPLSSYDKLPAAGQPVQILTHLHVREDAHILYGFMTAPERDLFRLLVNHVSGIGQKLALAVLSGMSVSNFKSAVVNADITSLWKISGLGKKTAVEIGQRDLLALGDLGERDRVAVAVPRQVDHRHDRVAAFGAELHGCALATRRRTGSGAGGATSSVPPRARVRARRPGRATARPRRAAR